MGLAQAEQKEVREREEGGSAREQWEPLPAPAGGQRQAAAGRQAGGLAGWLAGGRVCAWLCAERLLPGIGVFQAAGWGRGHLAISFSVDVSLGLLVSSSYCLL